MTISKTTYHAVGLNTPSTLEVSEGLSQLKRLDNDSLLLLIVSNLSVTGQREVLPQWVAIETVVGHDSPQIGMAAEEDTKQIPDFTLVPVRTVIEAGNGRHGSGLVGVGLDADARVVAYREHVVNDFETLAAGGVVYGGDVADLSEFGSGVLLEKGEDGNDTRGRDVDGEFIFPDGESVGGRSVSDRLSWRTHVN